jgi:hypothetical protein
MTYPAPALAGLRLSDHVSRVYSFADLGAALGERPDTLRTLFNTAGLVIMRPFDQEGTGGRGGSHRLHWRTVLSLLLVLKLNDYGFGLRNGEAAEVAGAVFTAGLELDHLCSEYSPLISVSREAGGLRVALIERGTMAAEAEAPLMRDGLEGVGTLLLDPIGFGRIIWRMAMAQAALEGEPAHDPG